MLHNNQRRFFITTLLVFSSGMWCGCRSMPGRNLFARNKEPSADVLAGTGPTTTYPAPPSMAATPQAIASVAGGTSNLPQIDRGSIARSNSATSSSPTVKAPATGSTPGYASPATNFAAANANGFATQGKGSRTNPKYGMPQPQQPSGSTNPSLAGLGSTTKSAPYTFGSKTFSPKTQPETSPALPANVATAGTPASYGASAYNMPPKTPATTVSFGSKLAEKKPAGTGFTLPDSLAATTPKLPSKQPAMATSAIAPPSISPTASLSELQAGARDGFTLPPVPTTTRDAVATVAANAPGFSTRFPAGNPSSAKMAPSGTASPYLPGSTRGASSYPGGKSTPSTSGSFYR